MQSFSAPSRAPIDADSLPPDGDVRHFLLDDDDGHAATSSFREMVFRVGTQLQLSDDTVAGFRRDGDPDGDSLPAVRRLVLEWLDICPLRVRTCWARTMRQWPIPPGPFPRVLLLQHDLDDSGRD